MKKEKQIRKADPFLSVVVPVYNEENNLAELYARLCEVFGGKAWTGEIIFVNDGSTDGTPRVLEALHKKDSRVRIIHLSRNHGHQIALAAGLDHVSGQIAVTMDGDLQHPPELLSQMVDKWKEGHEVVHAAKRTQGERSLLQKFFAMLFYRFFGSLADIGLPAHVSDFRLYGEKPLAVLRKLGEQEPFFRGLAQWMGFSQALVPYDPPARFSGEAKYTFRDLCVLAGEGFLSFSNLPLRLPLYVGAGAVAASLGYAFFSLAVKCRAGALGFTGADLFFTLAFFGGVQLCAIGLIGLYLGRLLKEVRARPRYVVEEKLGFGEKGP